MGAAYGLFCDEARRTGAFGHIVGIEPTPALAEACRGLGIEVIEAPYEKVGLDPPVDLIAAFEVIEHLYDPAGFLNWCYEALKAGGAVLLTCPNIAGFETLALGRHSGAIDHEHINLFTPQSLALLAERCGFREIDVTTPGRLDVELVQRAIDDGTVRTEDLDPIVQRLMAGLAPSRLQEIVREAGLSSNMQLAARR